MTAQEQRAVFDAWVARWDPWPSERAWADSQPSIGAAWDACEDGRWLESYAKRLGFWAECDGVRTAFDAAMSAASLAYDAERKASGQDAAMVAYDARVKAARRSFAGVMRAAVSRRAAESALSAWWDHEKAVTEKIQARRAANGGVYRGADDWSELPRRPEGSR